MPRAYHRPSEQAKAAAEAIRQSAVTADDRIRGRRELSEPAKRSAIAKNHVQARAKLRDLEQQSTASAVEAQQRLTAQAFSVSDMGLTPSERAAAAVNYRDALDRAAKLTSTPEVASALALAEDTGDELLARAIAHKCYSERAVNPANVDLLQEYINRRPDAVGAAISELMQAQDTVPSMGDLLAFSPPSAAELDGVQGHHLDSIAAEFD